MRVIYNHEVDIIRIIFRNAEIEESDEDKPGVILDYDRDGNIIGMEIIDASKRMDKPASIEFETEMSGKDKNTVSRLKMKDER